MSIAYSCFFFYTCIQEHFSEVVVFGRRKATVPDGCGVTTDEEEQKGRLVQHIEGV